MPYYAGQGFTDKFIDGGRLSAIDSNSVYTPQNYLTPASTDTTAETVTFAAAHGWVTGTSVIVLSTVGGLTANTKYFINVVSSTVISFHASVAAAIAGTSKVNLTANITSVIKPIGAANTSLWFLRHSGETIWLYTGTGWNEYTIPSAGISLSLATTTTNNPYDIFLQDVSGTLTMSLSTVWSDSTTRADALTKLNGVTVLNSDNTKRWIGTIYTGAAGSCTDDERFRGILSANNQVIRPMFICPGYNNNTGFSTYSHNNGGLDFSQLNGGTDNRLIFVSDGKTQVHVHMHAFTTGAGMRSGIGLDSVVQSRTYGEAGAAVSACCSLVDVPVAGEHFLTMLGSAVSATVRADLSKTTGADFDEPCTCMSAGVLM